MAADIGLIVAAHLVALLATILAMRGGTVDSKKKGISGITGYGSSVLALALVGFCVSLAATLWTAQAQTDRICPRAESEELLEQATFYMKSFNRQLLRAGLDVRMVSQQSQRISTDLADSNGELSNRIDVAVKSAVADSCKPH